MVQPELAGQSDGRKFSPRYSGRAVPQTPMAAPDIPRPRGTMAWTVRELEQIGVDQALAPQRLQPTKPAEVLDPLTTDQAVIKGVARHMQEATTSAARPTEAQLFDFPDPIPDTERPEIIVGTNLEIEVYYAHEEAEARGHNGPVSPNGDIPKSIREAFQVVNKQAHAGELNELYGEALKTLVLYVRNHANGASEPAREDVERRASRTREYTIRSGPNGADVATDRKGENDGFHTGRRESRHHQDKIKDSLEKVRIQAKDDKRFLPKELEEGVAEALRGADNFWTTAETTEPIEPEAQAVKIFAMAEAAIHDPEESAIGKQTRHEIEAHSEDAGVVIFDGFDPEYPTERSAPPDTNFPQD